MNLKIVNQSGQEAGSMDLNPEVFSVDVNLHLIHEVVRWQRAKRRAGTACTKTRSNMSGGTKKPWKQKGTGSARAGSNVSPLWVGGAVVHGPLPRSYEYRLNKSTRKQALRTVLSDKLTNNGIMVLDSLKLEAAKTKNMVNLLDSLKIGTAKTMLVLDQADQGLIKASRNIPNLLVIDAAGANVYDIVNCKYLLVTKDSMLKLQARAA